MFYKIIQHAVFALMIMYYFTQPAIVIAKDEVLPAQLIIAKYEHSEDKLIVEILKTKKKIKKVIPFDYKTVAQDINSVKNLLNKNAPDRSDIVRLNELLTKMYAIFIDPIDEILSEDNIICLILDKDFEDYPFHLFMTDNRYFLEDHIIFYAFTPSQIYSILNEPILKHSDVKVTSNEELSDKLGKAILNTLDIHNIPALSEQASFEQFEYVFHSANVLYLATHGEYDKVYNTYHLQFDTKYLNIYDKIKLKLQSRSLDIQNLEDRAYKMRFLFANACESASHQLFPRKAQLIGIRSFIGSLWSHPSTDRASANVIKRFYKNWQNGMSKVEALIHAQRETLYRERDANNDNSGYRKNGDYPYFWAQFVLFGDWR